LKQTGMLPEVSSVKAVDQPDLQLRMMLSEKHLQQKPLTACRYQRLVVHPTGFEPVAFWSFPACCPAFN